MLTAESSGGINGIDRPQQFHDSLASILGGSGAATALLLLNDLKASLGVDVAGRRVQTVVSK